MNRYLIIGVVAILVIAGGWWYLNQSNVPAVSDTAQMPVEQTVQNGNITNPVATKQQTQPAVASVNVPSDWVKRVDEKGYSFFYPPTWVSENRSMPSGATGQYFVAMYPSSHTYTYPSTEPPQHIVGVTVFPLTQLQQGIDPSAWIEYDSANKQWISGGCTDFSMETGCTKAKNVTKTVVASNVTVGGIKSYVIGNQSPTYYLVPINSKYGVVITMTPGLPGLDATSQQILDSFRFTSI